MSENKETSSSERVKEDEFILKRAKYNSMNSGNRFKSIQLLLFYNISVFYNISEDIVLNNSHIFL